MFTAVAALVPLPCRDPPTGAAVLVKLKLAGVATPVALAVTL
jgi:hypothetical protein